MAVLSISRQFGAGGKTLGEMVAQRLGYKFLFERQLDTLADEAMKVAGGDADGSTYRDLVVDLLTNLAPSNFMDRWAGSSPYDEKQHIRALTQVIEHLADKGKVVMLGRGSQFILRRHPRTLRLLLVARMEDRIGFMIQNYEIDEQAARKLIGDADKKRARFLRQFYPGEPDEASLYHVVINTSMVPLETSTNQISKLAKEVGI